MNYSVTLKTKQTCVPRRKINKIATNSTFLSSTASGKKDSFSPGMGPYPSESNLPPFFFLAPETTHLSFLLPFIFPGDGYSENELQSAEVASKINLGDIRFKGAAGRRISWEDKGVEGREKGEASLPWMVSMDEVY